MSNRAQEGFENRIAALIASDLHLSLRYTWYAQRRGFLRKTLKAGLCDVVMGVPPGLPGVETTRPYYTSTYVFVTARQRRLSLTKFDDPSLRTLKIGLQTLGSEGSNPPPAAALAVRGLSANVVGFPAWADDTEPTPQDQLVGAVARGEIDTAIMWGPFAGYFAKHYGNRLTLAPIAADPRLPDLIFNYSIAIGVRSDAWVLRDRLQTVLDRRRSEIDRILQAYGVPRTQNRS